MKVLVTGATGFVGRALHERLPRMVVLSRSVKRGAASFGDGVVSHGWDPLSGPPPASVFAGIDAVINLAGEPVATDRWTADKKERIRQSRVLGTKHLIEGILSSKHRPGVLISASATGYYGNGGERLLTEATPPGDDFLATVCRDWEFEAMKAADAGIRVVLPRIGIVLGKNGGALSRMLPPFKLGLGGPLGDGSQWMSWIHLVDLVRLVMHLLETDSISGPVNAVSPAPVTNREFSRLLGAVLHRPVLFSIPKLVLDVIFGEMASVLLASQRVVPERLNGSGFTFQFSDLESSFRDILM